MIKSVLPLGQGLLLARSRRRNGEDIGFVRPMRMVVPSARAHGAEIEAISTSLRDLIDFVHGRVSEPWNIVNMPASRFLALNEIASNLERARSRP